MSFKQVLPINRLPSQIVHAMSATLSASDGILDTLRYELNLSLRARDEEGIARGCRDLGVYLFFHAEYADAARYLREACGRLEHRGDGGDHAVVMLYLGMLQERIGDLMNAIDCYDSCRKFCEYCGDEEGLAIAMEGLGGVYATLGEFPRALELLQRSLNIHAGNGNHELAGLCAMEIATVHGRLGDFPNALELLRMSLDQFKACDNELLEIRALSNLAVLYSTHGNAREALEHGLRALLAYEALGDIPSQLGMLVTVGRVYMSLEQQPEGLGCISRALRLADTLGDRHLLAEALMAIGEAHKHGGHLWKSIVHVERALGLAEAVGDHHLELRASEFLATAFESLSEISRALHYQKNSARIRMEIADSERQRAIAELRMRFDIERAERELTLSRTKFRELERELAHKVRENTSMALNLVHKSELLDAVRANAEKIRKSAHGALEELESLLRQIAEDGRFDEDWRVFEAQLGDADREFVGTLSRSFPSLTPEELKVCLLLKTNLTTKQIAALRFVSNRTVENQRFRIREKLGLPPRANLVSFLASL